LQLWPLKTEAVQKARIAEADAAVRREATLKKYSMKDSKNSLHGFKGGETVASSSCGVDVMHQFVWLRQCMSFGKDVYIACLQLIAADNTFGHLAYQISYINHVINVPEDQACIIQCSMVHLFFALCRTLASGVTL
jgi:hypothetical protein